MNKTRILVYTEIDTLKSVIKELKNSKLTIGFVPTMGALHNGHLSLIHKARKENNRVVVSIFVNPTQFNNPEDLKNYPRDLEADLERLDNGEVDLVFAPQVEEIYPPESKEVPLKLNLGSLETVMEGKHRPGHFKGVVQVVAKLFRIVEPDKAYFGEKDFQQLAIIRYMTKELEFPVKIIACPTVREADGLAMSSRNVLLTPEQREEAPRISKALFFVRDNWMNFSIDEICHHATSQIEASGKMKVEYISIADVNSLQPVRDWNETPVLRCCVAVQVGKVRLIDNVGIVTGKA